jgi:uncharacterized repeat protein (TIGR03803 family)
MGFAREEAVIMIRSRTLASTRRIWRSAIGGLLLSLFFAIPFSQAQTFTVLYAFHGKGDGKYPEGRLLQGREGGGLYSTTYGGGSFNYGTVFQIGSHGKESVLSSFWGGNGLGPESGLIQDSAGNFYGTTYDGGTLEGGLCLHGCGTVFKLDPSGKLTVLHAFTGGTDGGQPETALVEDAAGNLYGTTTIGGDLSCRYGMGCGVVFKLDPNGIETVLHAFSGMPDGWWPSGELVPDGQGNFYGTTWFGGPSDYGTVFKLNSSGQETILYSFSGISSGEYPNGPLVPDAKGNVYGTANGGGDTSCDLCGLVFELDTAGKETVLHTFSGSPDGAYPYAGLVIDSSGNLYGTTYGGGSRACGLGCGTVFKVDAHGNETVLHTFTGGTDGSEPRDRLNIDGSGNVYGTAPGGGDSSCGYGGCGVVFKIVP